MDKFLEGAGVFEVPRNMGGRTKVLASEKGYEAAIVLRQYFSFFLYPDSQSS